MYMYTCMNNNDNNSHIMSNYMLQGKPLVQHCLSNTGFLQKWRTSQQTSIS